MTVNEEHQVPLRIRNYTNDSLLISCNKAVATFVATAVDQPLHGDGAVLPGLRNGATVLSFHSFGTSPNLQIAFNISKRVDAIRGSEFRRAWLVISS